MKIITIQQMQSIEEKCEKEYSITNRKLMSNAGSKIGNWVFTYMTQNNIDKDIAVVAGKGNNGGDAVVTARELAAKGIMVKLILLADERQIKGLVKQNLNTVKKKRKIKIKKVYKKKHLKDVIPFVDGCVLFIDGILGTGVKGKVKGISEDVIGLLNDSRKKIISVDIPSGMNGNTGEGICIKADYTLTLGLPKVGLFRCIDQNNTGKIIVLDIGIPDEIVSKVKSGIEYLYRDDFIGVLPSRDISAHKGSCGKVFIVAGSRQYTGAAYLTAMGALRSGAGMVYLGVPASLQQLYQTKSSEIIVIPLAETEDNSISSESYKQIIKTAKECDSMIIGPGLGQHSDTVQLIKKVIAEIKNISLLVDADAINALIKDSFILRKAKTDIIITPHPGEMARFLNTSVKRVQEDRWKITRAIADKYGITVVLKGSYTVISGEDDNIYINSTGNPGMATAGMGDVLSGIIGALMAQGCSILDSARAGVYVHGHAGDLSAYSHGRIGLIANDVIDNLPRALNSIYEI